MYHKHDFNPKAEHHFFATSYGKSPCDGIGGTIKREAANASLRAAVTNQILTSEQFFLWAKENINVTMYYVTEEDIINSHKRKYDLKVCYHGVQTVYTWYMQLSLFYSRWRISYNEENLKWYKKWCSQI